MKLNKLMLSAIVVCSFATPVSAMELETTVAPQQTDVKSSSFSKNDATAKLFEIAITGKNVEQIPELIKAGADVNARIKDGADVINVQYVDYIILTCAMKGPSSFVDFLLKKASSSDVNALDDYKKNTPLHCAAMYGHLSVVKVLVKAGADVNARDDYKKNTPLNWAAMHGHLSVVEVLVKAGADVNAQNYEGKTPLHCAAMNGHLSLVKVLVKAGAYVNALDNGGETPLHYAAAHDTADTAFVIKALVKSGADVNAQDKFQRATPLHLASSHGHLSNAKTLIAAGADVNAKNCEGETPLHYAAAGFDTADTAFVIKALVKSGANINAQDKIKRATPLHLASRHGHLSNAKTLIAAGGIDCGLN